MKRIIWIFLVMLFMVPTLSQAGIIGPANIRFVDGDVLFRTPDDNEWLPASINTPLDEGDAVWVSDGSRVEIQLPDGTVLRMDGGSQLDLLSNEDGFIHLHLASGRLYLRTSQTSSNNALQIDADDTTVLPASRTRLRLDMLPNSQEDVAIFKGTAYVEGNGNRTNVRAGEHIALEEGHSELLPLNPSDSWEIWNLERDRAQSRSAKLDSNLPDELRSHSAELDANGTWVRVPEYGMVWRPTVVISDDWAPYRSGRWIWKGDDYVWISHENWGWVPYHFGRWAVVSGFGWCWVPPVRGDVYWGPGFVGWFHTGSHVGWTPLAPGEIFYGRRTYGRHSTVITNANVNPATVVYRNRNNRGGLTVIAHTDFQRGRTIIHQQPSGNTAASISVSIGSPRIKPLRETRMPIIKQTPPRVAPHHIEQRSNRELRERFPRVPTPETTPQHRHLQSPTATSAPVVPSSQNSPVREKQTVYPATQPHDVPQKREEYRQRATAPQPAPSVLETKPQRQEQPNRGNTPAPQTRPEQLKREESRQQRPALSSTTTQPVPMTTGNMPQRAEQHIRTTPTAAPRPPQAAPQHGERPNDVRQKKVWKVTTPESTGADNKEKGRKER